MSMPDPPRFSSMICHFLAPCSLPNTDTSRDWPSTLAWSLGLDPSSGRLFPLEHGHDRLLARYDFSDLDLVIR